MHKIIIALLALAWTTHGLAAWDPGEVDKLDGNAGEAIAALKAKDPDIQRFFDAAAGYVAIPTVAKAGLGIGGARGNYELGAQASAVAVTK